MKKTLLSVSVLFLGFGFSIFANELISKAPAGAKVYFIQPADGQTVSKKFKVKFGLSGMGIAPAGANFDKTGHHHLLIDADTSKIDMVNVLPANEQIRHFGGGQTEAEIKLSPGKHTLQLLLGNFVHIPHNKPVMSKKITIIIK